MKFTRTKPFLLATAGSTVDGRVIDDDYLKGMATSYDPKTYGARLNIEHLRGFTGDGPFRCYGDVAELTTAIVDVNMNGSIEKRLGLFGSFDVLEDAKKLNAAGQKVYPSIEIEPNFAGKGFPYLMGVALTDSPASVATERLQFNRSRPGTHRLDGEAATALEFMDEKGDATETGSNFLDKLGAMLDTFGAKFSGKPAEQTPPAGQPEPAAPGAFSMDAFKSLFTEFGTTLNGRIDALTTEVRGEVDQLGTKLAKLSTDIETTAAPGQTARPPASGTQIDLSKVF